MVSTSQPSITANVCTTNKPLLAWVEAAARLTRPDRIHWCDGSEGEYEAIIGGMLADGSIERLNSERWPKCYLYRSNPNDVARTEEVTYICSATKEEAGPTNNWMKPSDARDKMNALFDGCMRGRTMFVIPYLMGPAGGGITKFGVEITDSPYVAANMRIMTRMGQVALDHLGAGEEIIYGMHSVGECDPDRRFIMHFPQDRLIMSYGSGYGGNALLGKKCYALRLASVLARDQGWLAEHMLIMGVEDPKGNITYISAAFPSACGKTNLAMLIPPAGIKGWRIWTVGDDIAWLRPGADGRLWAINPDAGCFGVVPGTNDKTNPNAMTMMRHDTIFTNVAVTPSGDPWWEGLGDPPESATDWKGNPWTPRLDTPAAHPNSRFTAPISQCPSVSPKYDDPAGVPISAFIFGGRSSRLAPLVYQARSWRHGVYMGATVASEATAAATGVVGEVKRDPMAMRPFCGYNMADYWGHWLDMGTRGHRMPEVFHVNWFRRDANNRFLWPGYGENLRVLQWIIERVNGGGSAVDSPIGLLPGKGSINIEGLDLPQWCMDELFHVDPTAWRAEAASRAEYFKVFGDHLPAGIAAENDELIRRLG